MSDFPIPNKEPDPDFPAAPSAEGDAAVLAEKEKATAEALSPSGVTVFGPGEGLPNSPAEDVSPASPAAFEGAPTAADTAANPSEGPSDVDAEVQAAQEVRASAEKDQEDAAQAILRADEDARAARARAVAADQAATRDAEREALERAESDAAAGYVAPSAEVQVRSKVPLSTRPDPDNPTFRIETFRNPAYDGWLAGERPSKEDAPVDKVVGP